MDSPHHHGNNPEGIADFLYPIHKLSGEQNHRCAYCGLEMDIVFGLENTNDSQSFILGPQHATREHVIPRSEGGSNGWENLVAACNLCNQFRETHNPHWYANFLNRLFTLTKLQSRWHRITPSEKARVRKIIQKSHRKWKHSKEITYNKIKSKSI